MGFVVFLVILGLLAALTLLVPGVPITLIWTFIGLPLGYFLMTTPFLFLFFFGSWAIYHIIGGGLRGLVGGVLLTIGLLAIPPFIGNHQIEKMVKSLTENDHDDGFMPKGEILAILTNQSFANGPSEPFCDGLCQRLLLNKQASKVLIGKRDINLELEPNVEVQSFRLEKRETCPSVSLVPGYNFVEIHDKSAGFRAKRVDELMNLEIAKGNCLIGEMANLASADYVISFGLSHFGKQFNRPGISIFADTTNASRVMLHVRDGNEFREKYRKTSVAYKRLARFFAPTAVMNSSFDAMISQWWVTETVNTRDEYRASPNVADFLTERLKFDLALREGNADTETRALLRQSLSGDENTAELPAEMSADFLRSMQGNKGLQQDDFKLALAVLKDERYPVTSAAFSVMRKSDQAPEGFYDDVAAVLFNRLHTAAKEYEKSNNRQLVESISTIGQLIEQLPSHALRAHKEDLVSLAQDQKLRLLAYRALPRLSEFGTEQADLLILLVKESMNPKPEDRERSWNVYKAGLSGLCRFDSDGTQFISNLVEILKADREYEKYGMNDYAMETLLAMGEKQDRLWTYAQPKKYNQYLTVEVFRRKFDKMLKAASHGRQCEV